MRHHLVLTAVGSDRPGICNQMTQIITQANCNIIDSQIALYGDEFTLIMFISGSSHEITRLETILPAAGQEHNLMMIIKRTTQSQLLAPQYKVSIQLQSQDRQGLTEKFTKLYDRFNININELSAQTKSEDKSTHPQFNISMVGGCHRINSDEFEEAFKTLCEAFNIQGQYQITAQLEHLHH